jgi:hypothetical protein
MVGDNLWLPVAPSSAVIPHPGRYYKRKTVNFSMDPGCSFGEAGQTEEPVNFSKVYR